MVIWQDLTENDLERKLGEFEVVEAKGKTKEGGHFDASRVMARYHKQLLTIPDMNLGAYLMVRGTVGEAIGNANNHGGDELYLSMRYSLSGILVTIDDNGNGFNVAETTQRYQDGEKHYNLTGQGFQSLDDSPADVCFNEAGNKTFIGYFPDGSEKEGLKTKAREYRSLLRNIGKTTMQERARGYEV